MVRFKHLCSRSITLFETDSYLYLKKRDHQSKQSTASSASSPPSAARTRAGAPDLSQTIKFHHCIFKCKSYPFAPDESDSFTSLHNNRDLVLIMRSLIVLFDELKVAKHLDQMEVIGRKHSGNTFLA